MYSTVSLEIWKDPQDSSFFLSLYSVWRSPIKFVKNSSRESRGWGGGRVPQPQPRHVMICSKYVWLCPLGSDWTEVITRSLALPTGGFKVSMQPTPLARTFQTADQNVVQVVLSSYFQVPWSRSSGSRWSTSPEVILRCRASTRTPRPYLATWPAWTTTTHPRQTNTWRSSWRRPGCCTSRTCRTTRWSGIIMGSGSATGIEEGMFFLFFSLQKS